MVCGKHMIIIEFMGGSKATSTKLGVPPPARAEESPHARGPRRSCVEGAYAEGQAQEDMQGLWRNLPWLLYRLVIKRGKRQAGTSAIHGGFYGEIIKLNGGLAPFTTSYLLLVSKIGHDDLGTL
jgi:hypothetical protein